MLKQLKFRDCLLVADQRVSNLTDDKCKNLREFYNDKKKIQPNETQRLISVPVYKWLGKIYQDKPTTECISQQVNMKGISDKDYEYAKQV